MIFYVYFYCVTVKTIYYIWNTTPSRIRGTFVFFLKLLLMRHCLARPMVQLKNKKCCRGVPFYILADSLFSVIILSHRIFMWKSRGIHKAASRHDGCHIYVPSSFILHFKRSQAEYHTLLGNWLKDWLIFHDWLTAWLSVCLSVWLTDWMN